MEDLQGTGMPETSQRTVNNQLLVSPALPAIQVQVTPSLRYTGEPLCFTLYESAEVEIFLFVEQQKGKIQRMLKFHFESLLPHVQQTYSGMTGPTIQFGQSVYATSTELVNLASGLAQRPNSDTVQVLGFLGEKGLKIEPEVMVCRFSRIIGEDQRSAFLISYFEDISNIEIPSMELTLNTGGNPWERTGKQVQKRALTSFTIKEG